MYRFWRNQDLDGDRIHQLRSRSGDLLDAEMRTPKEELLPGGGGS